MDKIQPACTLVDQQDTIFLVQDAKPVPVLQSRNLQSVCQYYYLMVHLRTIRSLRTIYGKFTVTHTDFEHV